MNFAPRWNHRQGIFLNEKKMCWKVTERSSIGLVWFLHFHIMWVVFVKNNRFTYFCQFCLHWCSSCPPIKVLKCFAFQINIRERLQVNRAKSVYLCNGNKLLTNCCSSYLKLAGRPWVMQQSPPAGCCSQVQFQCLPKVQSCPPPSPWLCPSQSKSQYFVVLACIDRFCWICSLNEWIDILLSASQKSKWSSYSSAQSFNWYFVSRKVIIDIYVLQN